MRVIPDYYQYPYCPRTQTCMPKPMSGLCANSELMPCNKIGVKRKTASQNAPAIAVVSDSSGLGRGSSHHTDNDSSGDGVDK